MIKSAPHKLSISQSASSSAQPAATEPRIAIGMRKHILLSVCLAVLLMAVTNFAFPIHWETGDDVNFAMLFSGVGIAAHSDYHNIYSNVIWTYPIHLLYQFNPHVPWYPVALCLVLAGALATIAAVFIDRFKPAFGTAIFALFYLCSGIFVVDNLQYTSVAALTAQAGFLVAMSLFARKRISVEPLILACGLAALASLIRYKSFELAFLLSATFAAVVLIPRAGTVTDGANSLSARLVTAKRLDLKSFQSIRWWILVLIICVSLKAVSDRHYNSDPQWGPARELAMVATPISDFRLFQCTPETRAKLATVGLSDNDVMILGRTFYADKYYSLQRLKQGIAIAASGREFSLVPSLFTVVAYALSFIVFAALAWSYLDVRQVSVRRLPIWVMGVGGLIFVMALLYRVPPRIYFAVLPCVTSSLLLFVDPEKLKATKSQFVCSLRKRVWIAWICAAAAITGVSVFCYEFLWIPAQKAIARSAKLEESIRRLSPDSTKLYLYLTPVSEKDVSPWADVTKVFANLDLYKPTYFSRSPVGNALLAKHGCASFNDALKSPNTFVLTEPRFVDSLSKLVWEHDHKVLSLTAVPEKRSKYFHVWKPSVH